MDKKVNEALRKKYKERGFQQVSLDEYLQKRKKAQKKRFQLPLHIKIIMGTPFLIIFCYGLFFIPYMMYVIATSPMEDPHPQKPPKSNTEKTLPK